MTQKSNILAALKSGERMSKRDMLHQFGCWNSGNVIMLLRKDGHDIETTMMQNGKKRWAEYWLK